MRNKLPTKGWYVVVTDDNESTLKEWRGTPSSLKNRITGMCLDNGKLSKEHNPVGDNKGPGYDFGEEITFEEFKVLVLGEEPTDPQYEIY